jgi:lipopolysaccharide export system protein LptA
MDTIHASFMPSCMRPIFAPDLALFVALLMLATPSWAERADRDKPMHIAADALRHDEAQQATVITGNVVIQKGTISLRGQQALVRQAPDGSQHSTLTASTGDRAFFRQKREGVDEWVEGLAQRLTYDSRTDTVRLEGAAVLRRLKGTQLNDETTGQIIVYSGQTEVFTVDGAAAMSGQGGGRVRAMLTPVRQTGVPDPSPAATAPALKPSDRLKEAMR